jgi:predicted phosphodiesterase
MDITIQNFDDSAYVYIGGEDVTSEDFGFRLNPGSAISFELPGKDALYAITDTDESQIAVLKTNLETGN